MAFSDVALELLILSIRIIRALIVVSFGTDDDTFHEDQELARFLPLFLVEAVGLVNPTKFSPVWIGNDLLALWAE